MRLFDSTLSAILAGILFAFVYGLGLIFAICGSFCLWPNVIQNTPVGSQTSMMQYICSTVGHFGSIVLLVIGLVMLLNMTFLMCFIVWTWCCSSSRRAEARRRQNYAAINIGSVRGPALTV